MDARLAYSAPSGWWEVRWHLQVPGVALPFVHADQLAPPVWECNCFSNLSKSVQDLSYPDASGSVCSDEEGTLAFLACNGIPLVGFGPSLEVCTNYTGCNQTSCNIGSWVAPGLLPLHFPNMYTSPLCYDAPPSPPPCEGRHCWCEMEFSPFETQTQLVNTFSNLPGLWLATRSLFGLPRQPYSALHRTGSTLLAFCALGSAAHHSFPRVQWTHSADIVPILALTSVMLLYGCLVLSRVLQLPPSSAKRDALICASSAVSVVQWMLYSEAFRNYGIGITEGVGMSLGANVLVHAALWLIVLWSSYTGHGCRMRDCACRGGSCIWPREGNRTLEEIQRRVTPIYISLVIASGVAAFAQRIEYRSCPEWLESSHVGLHGLWHLLVLYVANNALAVLLYFEHRVAYPDIELVTRCAWCPWLLFHPEVKLGDHVRDNRKNARVGVSPVI
jgi:hypothetical protein